MRDPERDMLIHNKTQKIVLNLGKPDRVLSVIPTAKAFEFKGHTLVAVPHRLDETRVLRNLGIKVPAPIEHHYTWSGQFAPFHAQQATSAFLTLNQRAFCLNDLGTGKTLSTLWAFDYLRSIGAAKKLLVVSPLSTLERTWGDEIFRHFPHLNFAVLYGTKARRTKMLGTDADVYLINHDGVKVLEKELVEKGDIDIVVVDEIASFRNASTERWKALSRVIAGRTWVWGLTGTPTPNEPTDAWAQCRLIVPHRVPKYQGKFRDMVMRQFGPFTWLPRDTATQIVADAMQPAIRFRRDECVDLPPVIYMERHAELTDQQKRAYQEMVVLLRTEIGDKQALAANAAVKLSKLVQIACGVVYGKNGEEMAVPAPARIEATLELIEQAHGKVIVFVPFTAVLKYVAGEIAKAGYTVATIGGGTPKAQRDEIFGCFQGTDNPEVLVAQPASMSHGLTLTAADTVIWYGPVTSNEVLQQANARISRPGQKRKQIIAYLSGTPVERRIYDRLGKKQSLQGLLLDILKDA